MACDGNCQSCPIQCGLTTLNKLESKAKEKTEMSEGALNCKSGDAEKIAVLLNENEISSSRSPPSEPRRRSRPE